MMTLQRLIVMSDQGKRMILLTALTFVTMC